MATGGRPRVCICLGYRVYVQFSAKFNYQSRRKAKGSSDHFLSVPEIHELESVISKWNSRTSAQNKIRGSESHRLQASHDVGGRAHGEAEYPEPTHAQPAQPQPEAEAGAGPGASTTAETAPPRLLLFPSPPSRPRPQTQTFPAAGARDLPVVARAEMLLLAAAGLVAFVLLLYMVSPLISPKPLALPGAHVVVSGLLLLSLPRAAWPAWATETTVPERNG